VLLEISESAGHPDRMAEIAVALHQMYMADLMPDDVVTDIFLYFDNIKGIS
jgi:hypothetical protein